MNDKIYYLQTLLFTQYSLVCKSAQVYVMIMSDCDRLGHGVSCKLFCQLSYFLGFHKSLRLATSHVRSSCLVRMCIL